MGRPKGSKNQSGSYNRGGGQGGGAGGSGTARQTSNTPDKRSNRPRESSRDRNGLRQPDMFSMMRRGARGSSRDARGNRSGDPERSPRDDAGDCRGRDYRSGSARRSPETHDRGRSIDRGLHQMSMSPSSSSGRHHQHESLNDPTEKTWHRINSDNEESSTIDLVLCTATLESSVHDWKVIHNTSSDHSAISFTIQTNKPLGVQSLAKTDWAVWASELDKKKGWQEPAIMNAKRSDMEGKALVKIIVQSWHKACPISCPKRHRLAVPWWNEKLSALKKQFQDNKGRLKLTSADHPDREQIKAEVKLSCNSQYG
jgi:hypothetical protein